MSAIGVAALLEIAFFIEPAWRSPQHANLLFVLAVSALGAPSIWLICASRRRTRLFNKFHNGALLLAKAGMTYVAGQWMLLGVALLAYNPSTLAMRARLLESLSVWGAGSRFLLFHGITTGDWHHAVIDVPRLGDS